MAFDAALQQAQRDMWNSMPEEHRNAFLVKAASRLPTHSNVNASTASDVPRSMSFANPSTHQNPSHDVRSMDRVRSEPGSVPMGRSGSGQFSHSNFMPNLANQRSQSTMSAWQCAANEEANTGYTCAPRTSLHTIEESSATAPDVVEYTPAQFIGAHFKQSASPALVIPSQVQHNRLHMTQQLITEPQWSRSFDCSSPSDSPSTAPAMTPSLTASSTMSLGDSVPSSFPCDQPMIRFDSSFSDFSYPFVNDGDGTISLSSAPAKTTSPCEDALFSPGFTGSSGEALFSSNHVSPSAFALISPFSTLNSVDLVEDMRRSPSTSSSNSASAALSSRRHVRRDREINAAASRVKIAPKAVELKKESSSPPPSAQMIRVPSLDGSTKVHGVIPKVPYTRPTHPKIMCNFCDDHPSGFRGTHELERHIHRHHNAIRKAYICIDASDDGKFLSGCKHCRNNKVYGAYYNAAAHLRRAHFHPRKRGRKGKNDEKRGGSGGGDDPPMDYLRQNWIKEVEIENVQANKRDDSNTSNVSSDADDTIELDLNVYRQPQADIAPLDFNQQMFGNSFMPATDASVFQIGQSGGFVDPNHFQFDAEMSNMV